MYKIGDKVWYLGEEEDLQEELIVMDKLYMGLVIRVRNSRGDWMDVEKRNITYTKPTLPEESYLYG